MPTIPRYQRTRSIPGTSGSVKASEETNIAQGLASVSQGVGDVSAVLLQHREKQRQQDRVNRALTIGAAFDDEARAFEAAELQRTGQDAFDNLARGEEFRKSAYARYTADLDDPELKIAIDSHINGRTKGLLDGLSRHQAAQRVAVTKQALDLTVAGALKDVYGGQGLQPKIDQLARAVQAQHLAGAIGAEEAENLLMASEQQLAEAHLDGLINRDPVLGMEAIASGTYAAHLPQEKIEEYDKKAKTLAKALRDDAKAQAKEAERVAQEQRKEAQAAIGNEFVAKLVDGQLTEVEIVKADLEPTGENSKQYWLKQLKERGKKTGEWTTDPAIEADLFTRLTTDPAAVPELEILEAQGAGLSTADAKSLIAYRAQRLGKDTDPLKSEDAKIAVRQLADAKTNDLFSSDEKANAAEWGKSAQLLKQYILNNPDGDPVEFVNKLTEPAKVGFIDRLFGDTAKIEKERTTRLEAEASGKPAGAKQAPDGNWYVPDPDRPGKYLRLD